MSITLIKKLIATLLISPIIAFYSPVGYLLQPLLWLVIIDILTGVYCAKFVRNEDINSRGFLSKLVPVCLFLIALTAALHCDIFFVEFGLPQHQAPKLILAFYGVYELISILENLGDSGLPVAKQISSLLKKKLPQEVQDELNKEEKKDDTTT